MRRRQGITLIEGIVVIVLVAIIATVIAFYIREGFEAWIFLSGQKNIALSTRAAMNRMVRELKRVKKNTGITSHAADEITFLDVYNNTVTFSQQGTSLFRNSDVLLDDLQDSGGLAFSYLDKDGNETAIPDQMGLVRIRLTTEKEGRFVLESAARIRIRRIK